MVVPMNRRKFLAWTALGLASSAGTMGELAWLQAWPGTWPGPGHGNIVAWAMETPTMPRGIMVWRMPTDSDDCGVLIKYELIAGAWVSSIPECTIQRLLTERVEARMKWQLPS